MTDIGYQPELFTVPGIGNSDTGPIPDPTIRVWICICAQTTHLVTEQEPWNDDSEVLALLLLQAEIVLYECPVCTGKIDFGPS